MINEGTGQDKILQFYYNHDFGYCLPFFYKGEGGNGNRFDTDQHCMEKCSSKYHELFPEGGKKKKEVN